MRKRMARVFCIVVAASLFLACGDDSPASNPAAAGSSTITYRLTPEADPVNFTNGSIIGVKSPPRGQTGLVNVTGLSGTFQVVREAPTRADLVLDYRITRVEMSPVTPRWIVGEISAQGDELGRIQLHTDGTFSMRLQIPIDGITYDLSLYTPDPPGDRYYFDAAGRLVLRNVKLRTAFEEPYFGNPVLILWADPES
jgi:hypothetical protein